MTRVLDPVKEHMGHREPPHMGRCGRCGCNFDIGCNKPRACRYHDGTKRDGQWTCCGMLEQDSGCRFSPHRPCQETQLALDRLDRYLAIARLTQEKHTLPEHEDELLVDFSDSLSREGSHGDGSSHSSNTTGSGSEQNREEKEQCEHDDDKECIWHEVRPSDTLAGLAIKYGVNVDIIKRANNLSGAVLGVAQTHLLVPKTVQALNAMRVTPVVSRCNRKPPREDALPTCSPDVVETVNRSLQSTDLSIGSIMDMTISDDLNHSSNSSASSSFDSGRDKLEMSFYFEDERPREAALEEGLLGPTSRSKRTFKQSLRKYLPRSSWNGFSSASFTLMR